MDKLQMAHDYFMGMISRPSVTLKEENLHSIQHNAWEYADAMQAEAEKRKPSGLPEALCQVDWSQAPLSAHAWQMVEGCAVWINSHGTMGYAPTFGFTGSHIVERPHGF